MVKKYNPGTGNFTYNFMSLYKKVANETFINKWHKHQDYNYGNTKSSYFNTMAISNDSAVIMAMDVEYKYLLFVNASSGEMLWRINVEGTGNLNIRGAILLHQSSLGTYAAYYVMRKQPYYKVA